MKTLLSKAAVIGVGLLTVPGLSSTAMAGPGPQYWQQQARLRTENAAKPDVMKATATHLCPAAQTVPVTAMKAWSNGRGPLREVQVGTKTVCHACPITVVTTNAWSNGRGPVTMTEVTKHTCTNCTAEK